MCVSLSYNNAPKFIGRDVLREEESVCCQKLRLFKGCLPNIPTPHTLLQVSSSRQNFIRAGVLYKLITRDGTSHLLSVCVCWGAGGCWVWRNIFIRGSSPPPTPHDTRKYLPSQVYFLNLFTGLLVPDHCLPVFTLMFRSC